MPEDRPRSRRPRRRWIKRALLVIVVALLALTAVVLIRTATFSSRQLPAEPAAELAVSRDDAVGRLAEAIRVRTISMDPSAASAEGAPVAGADSASGDPSAFADLRALLERFYPAVHETLHREIVAEHSVLFTWPGRDGSLEPALLMGHMDVVPIDPGSRDQWTHPPFSGAVADGFIWGRGSLDDKVTVLGILEAVELLLAQRHVPERTVYLAFGHDEELGGDDGAARIAALLASRGVTLTMVLDEGLPITRGVLSGVDVPIAAVGLAEKGDLTLDLVATTAGGHSSIPPRETSIGLLAAAIERLQNNPMPGSLDGVVRDMLSYVGPEMPFGQRVAMANLWLLGPVVESIFAAAPGTNALLRTTMAPTVIRGGNAVNVLPQVARASINFRVMPGDTIESVTRHVRDVVADSRITIEPREGREASPVSDPDSPAFRLMQRSIRQVFPTAITAPGLLVGGADAKHYQALSSNIYRFAPIVLGREDLDRLHGVDERIAIDNYVEVIRFYAQVLRNLDSLE